PVRRNCALSHRRPLSPALCLQQRANRREQARGTRPASWRLGCFHKLQTNLSAPDVLTLPSAKIRTKHAYASSPLVLILIKASGATPMSIFDGQEAQAFHRRRATATSRDNGTPKGPV